MARFKELVEQYQPTALILEKFDASDSRRSERIRMLAQTMHGFARSHDMDTLVYSREEVSASVAGSTNVSRHKVALAVAEQLPILQHRLPKERKLWQSEDRRQCLFDAAALGITHYMLTRPRYRRT
jgi:Holliday junction resolvasome RuvABC endonuclease subunit